MPGIAYLKQVNGVPQPFVFQSGNILGLRNLISKGCEVCLYNEYTKICSMNLSSVSEVPIKILIITQLQKQKTSNHRKSLLMCMLLCIN